MSDQLSIIWDAGTIINAATSGIDAVGQVGNIPVTISFNSSGVNEVADYMALDRAFTSLPNSNAFRVAVARFQNENPGASLQISFNTNEGATSGTREFFGNHIMVIATDDLNYGYITQDGRTAEFTLEHILAHEFAHMLTDMEDGDEFNAIVNEIISEVDGSLPRSDDYDAIFRLDDRCFLPGTPITLADGVTTKPIEEIGVGDEVLSYTHDGTLVPGRVTATSSKTASIVLDWFGLGVTPGHVTLCGYVPDEESTPAGPFMGRHVPLIDILCADGAVVRQDGSLVRAATNEPVGSRADAFVHLAYSRTGEELKAGVSHEASIRSGTKLITGEGNTVRVLDVIETNGYQFDEETGLVSRPLDDGTPGVPGPLPFFGMPPKPEDHVLARSGTTLEAIHRAGEWEGEGSQLPAPTPARATPAAAMSPPMNRKQRRALMARGRRAH